MGLSSETSIFVEWDAAGQTEVPILGYKLYISVNATGEYTLLYSNQNPLLRHYNATNLVTG